MTLGRLGSWLLSATLLLAPWHAGAAKVSSRAKDPSADALEQRLQQLQALFVTDPSGLDEIFSPEFLRAVPPDRLTALLRDYQAKGGQVRSVLLVERNGAFAADYRFFSERTVFPVKLTVASNPPHKVIGLWFGVAAPTLSSIDEAVTRLKQLPGSTSFALCELGEGSPRITHAHDADRALAIGSTFKLYILGALMAEIAAERRAWSDTVRLLPERKSWPSGELHTWPDNAPVTLSTLATMMISRSDNTATDQLMLAVGRERVESMLTTMGNQHRKKNLPLLTTREMFLLKSTTAQSERWRDRYLKATEKARRRLLRQSLAKAPRDAFAGLDQSTPLAIDGIEWFASTADLCRAMDWIRRHTASPQTGLGREIMKLNRGLSWNRHRWSYIGYKGGSEPGVLNMTWLLQRGSDSRWLAMSVSWNNDTATLDRDKLVELMQGVIVRLETTPAK